jgi:hypothetical protein
VESVRRTPPVVIRLFLFALLLLLPGLACAKDGPSVGLSFMPDRNTPVVNAQLAWPLLQWQPEGDLLHLSLRSDVSLAAGSGLPPAVGLAVLLGGRDDPGATIESYLGLGAGVAFASDPRPGPAWALYGVTGVRLGNPRGAAAILELQLAGTRQVLVPSASLGFSWRFGAAR